MIDVPNAIGVYLPKYVPRAIEPSLMETASCGGVVSTAFNTEKYNYILPLIHQCSDKVYTTESAFHLDISANGQIKTLQWNAHRYSLPISGFILAQSAQVVLGMIDKLC